MKGKPLFADRDELKKLAKKLGMEVLESINPSTIPQALIEKVPYTFVKRYRILPIGEKEGKVIVVSSDPLNLAPLENLRLMLDKEVNAYFSYDETIQSAIDACYTRNGETTKFIADLSSLRKKEGKEGDLESYDLLENENEAPIIRLLNLILSEAISQGASDIHFEPSADDLKVRYRIDGVLVTRHTPEKEHQGKILTRIKVMAKLDIAEHRLPQDGRIKLKMGGREIDFRVSTLPTAHGERIVLRILNRENVELGIEKLGMLPKTLDEFKKLIHHPEGMILVTGPTGSGKTTSLYSALSEINSEEINIVTIEDPVEYKIKGIAQIAVYPKIGLSFASGLRHILRQDPDVVMIGEIRDNETAEIACQASLTGHLVLSTLHTNDAPSALPRLIDMGIEPYLLSSTVIGVLAQRLVRTICPNCREGYIATKEELAEVGLTKSDLNGKKVYRGRGCHKCYNSGYQGRHGIYELLTITPALQSLITQRVDSNHLREAAIKEGMTTLCTHGQHLIRSGMTTIKEVLRLTRRR